jgi:ADP-ribosylglycohydrolase
MNKEKIKGLIFASFIGDAMALGPHWIYDTDKIQEHYAPITSYTEPNHTGYHPNKKAGDFTHYGDQSLLLLNSIAEHKEFNLEVFKKEWLDFVAKDTIYIDHATKESMQLLENSNKGSDSNELGGFARSAPLFALDDIDEETILNQIQLTHTDPQLLSIAQFFIRVLKEIIAGESIEKSLLMHKDMDPFIAKAYSDALSNTKDVVTRIKEIGQSCPSPFALPAVLTIVFNETDFQSALIKNAYAGGDSAARGMVLGMLYGARDGFKHLPKELLHGLNAYSSIEASMEKLGF